MKQERMTAAEFRAEKPTKRNKYGAKKTTIDGITFDSKAESDYYALLKMREKAGEVSGVEMQHPFALVGPDGLLIATYRCDFAFWDLVEGRFRVIDVKGVETPVFKLKRKLMKSFLGINVEVVA